MSSEVVAAAEPVLRCERAPILVRDIFEAKGYRELDEEEGEEGSPSSKRDAAEPPPVWHVYWKGGRFKPSEYAAANPLQRLNHFPKTMGITKKDCLLRNLRRMRATHGAIYNFFPESYILPSEYLTLVRVCEQRRDEQKPIWILKPTDSSQGRKIFIIRDLSEISYGHFSESMAAAIAGDGPPRNDDPDRDPKLDEKGRAISTELDMTTTLRMLKSRLHKTVTPCVKFTEMHIAQKYLERPLCFCGYKLDLRIYVLLLSAQPLKIYWFRDCLVRFATHKYDLNDLDNQYAHLTNTSINKFSQSYSTNKEGIRGGCKWSLLQFNREHPDHPLASPLLWARIKAIVNLTLLSIAAGIPDNGGCFELFGYDVMIDDALRPWLLEVNCSPALGCEEHADREVKEPLIGDLVDLLGMQREQATAALPAGGGARAVQKARGWPSRREKPAANSESGDSKDSSSKDSKDKDKEGSGKDSKEEKGEAARQQRRSSSSDAEPPAAAALPGARRKVSVAERMAWAAPPSIGGYEQIFPFNQMTERLSSNVGGNEASIVKEIQLELQKEAAKHAPKDEDGEDGSEGGETPRENNGREYSSNYAAKPTSSRPARPASARGRGSGMSMRSNAAAAMRRTMPPGGFGRAIGSEIRLTADQRRAAPRGSVL